MLRTLLGALGALMGLALAVAGVVALVWLLWWLWTRRDVEKPAAIEIDLGVPPPETETPVSAVRAGEEALSVEAEAEEEVPVKLPPTKAGIEAVTEGPPAPDDLKRIEGIGPKISGVLQEAGITTFADLADAEVSRIEQILEDADPRLLRLADATSWPEQAALASSGEWEALEALQNELKRGRRG